MPPTGFTVVSAGAANSPTWGHSLALAPGGRAYAWGDGQRGQLGNGATQSYTWPVAVSAPEGVTFVDVSAGMFHSLGLTPEGAVYAWGRNASGELGDGSTVDSSVPVVVDAPRGVTFTAISAGALYSVALASDGTAYTWGNNENGQLGDGTTTSSTTPVAVVAPDGVTFTEVVAGEGEAFAQGSDGLTYAWGGVARDGWGHSVLGNADVLSSTLPLPVTAPDGVSFTSVAAGSDHAVAVGSDGRTYAWGANARGQLGTGTTERSRLPVAVTTPPGVTFTSAAAGFGYSLAVGSDGLTYAWGANDDPGRLGDGTTAPSPTPVLVAVPDGVRFTAVFAATGHSLALGSDGLTYSWGANNRGQLGTGSTVGSASPVPVRGSAEDAVVESVTFGTAEGTDLTQDGATWSVRTPAHACGTVDVSVTSTAFGTSTAEVTEDGFTFGVAPSVALHPTSTDAPRGARVALAAEAEGDDVPDVQWQRAQVGTGDWIDLPGETSRTLDVVADTSLDFRAVFTNCLGTASTSTATVTVLASDDADRPDDGAADRPGAPDAGPGAATGAPDAGDGTLARTGAGVVAVAVAVVALLTTGAVLVRRRLTA